jgi:signal transduction histidine kinase
MTPQKIGEITRNLPATADLYEPVDVGGITALRMENALLMVTTGPFTPFFATEELQMLSASAVVADLALGRATLFELERQSRNAMRDFVAIASHDLRTPVSVIQGFSHLMSTSWDDLDEDDRKGFVVAIERQIVHLDRLIGDLLTVSKLDVGEVGTFAERLELTGVVTDAVRLIAGETDVDVSFADPTVVFADPAHVARMIQNYLSNALTHGSSPFAVEIGTEEGFATVRVRDSGSGVSECFVPRLFEKFARMDEKSKAARGTGLGLSIVRGLARANGGDAWYEPNKPKGACFAVRLPLAATRSDAQEVA